MSFRWDSIARERRLRVTTGALLIVSVFLLAHSYSGIRHDGILYAGDALSHLVQGRLHQDLYFLYGSQGQFTVLPLLYSKLITAFGLSDGTAVGLLTAFAFYLIATWLLLKKIVSRSLVFYCLLSLVLGWTLYGGRRVFGYSESFLTARSFAEPMVLLALAQLARRRTSIALLFAAGALALHPLVGLTGGIVVWLMLVRDDRRWLWVLAAGAVGLLAVAVHPFGPFSDLLQRYDPIWLDLVEEANPQAFILYWSWLDAGTIVFDIAVVSSLMRCAPGTFLLRLATTAVIAGLATVLVTFVAVDLLHSAFIGKLQIWRTLWIMHWVAMAALPVVVQHQWRSGSHGRLSALLLGIAWMAPFSIALAPLGVAAVAVDRFRARFSLSRSTVIVVGVLTAVIAAVICIQYEARVIKLAGLRDEPLHRIIGQAAAINVVLLMLASAIWRLSSRARWSSLGAAAVLFLFTLAFWDQRSAWTKRLESYPVGSSIWPGLIERDATVYWYRDLMAPWLLLGHANYYTQQQGSGAVFSRDMTIELDKRRKITGLLDLQEQVCRLMNNLNEEQSACEPDAEAVHTICEEGGIDYVVLQSRIEGNAPIADYDTGVVESGYEKKFFLYRCSALKSG